MAAKRVTRKKEYVYDGRTPFQRGMDYLARGVGITALSGLAAIGFTPTPGPQQAFLETPAFETLFGGAAGGGKAGRCPDRAAPSYTEDMETKVLTPKGFILFGDVRVGQAVCNPDGTVARVIQVHEQGRQQFYRVTLSDGSSVEASEGHLWAVSMAGARKRRKLPPTPIAVTGNPPADWNAQLMARTRIVTTRELAELVAREEAKRGSNARAYSVQLPLTAPVAFTAAPGRWPFLPAYTLGVLVGDGSLTGDTTRFTTADPHMAERIQAQLPGYTLTSSGKAGTEARDYRITGQSNGEYARKRLERDGLWGKYAVEKFIPTRIKHAPAETRWEFMQGLFDADGYIDDRGHVEYVTISARLAEDVQWMCRSLGLKATLSEKHPTYTHKGEKWEGELAYRLYIRGHNQHQLFSLPRKISRAMKFNGGDVMPSHRVVSVVPTVVDNARCITVDHPNSLYVTDDFIVTHNSAALIALAAADMDKAGHQAILFRRSFPQLTGAGGLVQKAKQFYATTGWVWRGGAMRYENTDSGATIDFRHISRDGDLDNYQGQEYSTVLYDELTQFDEQQYLYLLSRIRTPFPNLRSRIGATTNPGGRGGEWVKRRWRAWLDAKYASTFYWDGQTYTFGPAASGEIRWFARINDIDTEVPEDYPDAQSRTFISSRVTDNPYLMRDRQYISRLMQLPLLDRKRLLDGDWDIQAEGNVFKRQWFKIVPEWQVPQGLAWVRGIDMASTGSATADESATALLAIAPDGRIFIRSSWAAHLDWPDQRRAIKAQMLAPSQGGIHVRNGIEWAATGIPLVQDLQADEDLRQVEIRPISHGGVGKLPHAQVWASRAEQGLVYLVEGDWNEAFLDQAVVFTGEGDSLDDRVDAVSIAYRMAAIPGVSSGDYI